MSQYLLLLLLLACPLMMVLMMRGGQSHGRGDGGQAGHGHRSDNGHVSTDELRRQRDELDRKLAERATREDTKQ